MQKIIPPTKSPIVSIKRRVEFLGNVIWLISSEKVLLFVPESAILLLLKIRLKSKLAIKPIQNRTTNRFLIKVEKIEESDRGCFFLVLVSRRLIMED
jgi:hypothetical protein